MSDKNDVDKHKLKFVGCCTMTDEELSKLYNLDLLTDTELASVGLRRDSLIDDYRHLHEMSQLKEIERISAISERILSKLTKPKFTSAREPTKLFSYDILNKFFRCMQSESANFCRYMEQELKIYADFLRDASTIQLSPRELEFVRYESYFEYLDYLYLNGERNEVIAIVAKVMIHFHRDPQPVKLLPGFGRGYGPHYARNRTVDFKDKPNT